MHIIYGDGTNDDTPGFQDLIDGRPVAFRDGSVRQLVGPAMIELPGGPYLIKGTLDTTRVQISGGISSMTIQLR